MTLSVYSVEQDEVVPDHRRPGRSRASRSSIAAASISTSSDRPTPARCSTGSRSRRPTTAGRATSISSCCATTCRRRSRGRATRRSRPERAKPAADETAGRRGEAGAPTPQRRRAGARSISRASSTASSICRSSPAISPTCRPATRASLLPARAHRSAADTVAPGDGPPRAGCIASTSPSARTNASSTSVRDYHVSADARSCSIASATPGRSCALPATEGQRRPTGGSPSQTSKCGSTRAPSGRRSSTKRGGSTATTSTRRNMHGRRLAGDEGEVRRAAAATSRRAAT